MAYGASPSRPSGSVRGGGRLYEDTLVYAVVTYAIAAMTCPGTPLDKMDRRSLCQRGDGGVCNAVSTKKESINQSDVERVVRVRRRLLAAQQQLLDALVRQAEVLHRVRVLHEQLEQLAVARRQAHPAAALVVTI